MSFYKKYELDRLMADGDAKTFRAIENASGRVVFLHLFNPSGQALLAALKSKLGGTAGKPVAPLIEIGEFAGSPYAVTQAIEPFGNLREWIARNVTASNPLLEDSSPNLSPNLAVPIAAPPPKPPATPLLADTPAPRRAPPEPPPVVAPPPSAPPLGLVSEAPGEFTRLFREPTPPVPPPSAPPSGLVSEAPGEFTRLFREPTPAAPPPSAPPLGLVSEAPGEFTRLFHATPPAAVPASSPNAGTPSEFTKLFQPAQPVEPSWQPPPDAPRIYADALNEKGEFVAGAQVPPFPPRRPDESPETGQFTRLFGSRLPGESIDIEKEQRSAAQSSTPDSRPFQQAGEFTRMFGPHDGASAAPTPAKDQPTPSFNTATPLTSASGMFGEPDEMGRFAAQVLGKGKQPEAGPGEYTRLFETPKKPEEGAPPPAAKGPAPEAAPPRKSHRDLIVIVVCVVTLVALIVLAIVLRKH